MAIFSKEPLSVKDNWKTVFKLYREIFAKIWYLALVLSVIFISTLYLNAVYSDPTKISYALIFAVFSLVMSLAIVYLSSLILYQIYNIGTERKHNLQEEMLFIKKRYPKLIGCMIVVVVIYSLGAVAFLLPGIFLFILLAMAQPLVLIDEQNVFQSIKGSCKLVWGNWWRSFAVLFPPLIISYWIIYLVVAAAKVNDWLGLGLDVLFATFYYPLFYSCLLAVFNDLKLRKNAAETIIVT